MKRIKNADNNYLSEAQKSDDTQRCRISSFCIVQRTDEGVLLYHTVTGELLLLAFSEYEILNNGRDSDETWFRQLRDHGFLVSEDTDEYAVVDEMRVKRQQMNETAISSYTILPTTQCNAQCFYCYEKGISEQAMTLKTAEAVVSYITEHNAHNKISLSWFGGEPTVASDVITFICTRLREAQIEFESGIISNGYLFDEKLIRIAKDCWNLKNMQITIDGTETIYNATKNYKSAAESPYRIVLSNIRNLLDAGIYVSVRINLGQHNETDVYDLLSELREQFSGNKYFSIYVRPINNCYSDDRYLELVEKSTDINIMLVKSGEGGKINLPSFRAHSCMADSKSAVLINPNGELGKCEHYIYKKLYGSIFRDDEDIEILNDWQERVVFRTCRRCPLYPTCYILKGCEGGRYKCSETEMNNKIREIQNSMLAVYYKWKHGLEIFKSQKSFILKYSLRIDVSSDQTTARFFQNDSSNIIQNIEVNDTAKDILVFLRERHNFRDIISMLNNKYDTSNYPLEDIVVNYLEFLLRSQLIMAENI